MKRVAAGCGGDGGSATIWVLAAVALIVLVATVTAVRSAAVVVRHRVESAADLSALAGAGRIGMGDDMCRSAAAVAADNGARLLSCVAHLAPDRRSGTVTTRVAVTVRLPLAGTRQVIAAARAARLPGARR